ncbi:MAG: hypothetical protein P8182_16300, partial [Deltaproteobacteria bacterium]
MMKAKWLCLLLLIIGVLVVYVPNLSESFAGLDLDAYHKVIYGTNFSSLAKQLLIDVKGKIVPGYYGPLPSISLLADKFLIGAQVPHVQFTLAVNVLIHCLNGILVFLLIRAIGAGLALAYVTSFLFLMHPIQVPSVLWVAQRKSLLMALFYLSAFLTYLKFRRDGSAVMYAFSLVLFAAGLLCKPTMVVLPAALLATIILIPG